MEKHQFLEIILLWIWPGVRPGVRNIFLYVDKTWTILAWSHCVYTWQICNNCRKLRITQRNLYQSIIIIPDTIILPHTPDMVYTSTKQPALLMWLVMTCVCKYNGVVLRQTDISYWQRRKKSLTFHHFCLPNLGLICLVCKSLVNPLRDGKVVT